MIAAPLQALTMFNMICTGMVGDGPLPQDERAGTPYRSEFRIDLIHRLWCIDTCHGVERIQGVTDREIILIERTFDGGGSARMAVDRRTGTFLLVSFHQRIGPLGWRRGTCRPRPFGGFPEHAVRWRE